MNKAAYILMLVLFTFQWTCSRAQPYEILIQHGHVFDPANNIDTIMDIAISGGRIVELGFNISAEKAQKRIDATGFWVCPGFIDIHTHVFVGSNKGFANGINSLSPDDFSFKSGVTTMVDAGTSGFHNFEKFLHQVIETSKTRILAFLNISGAGMVGKPEEEKLENMNPDSAFLWVQKYPDIIVGIKIGHFEGISRQPFENALKVCERASVPLFVECHLPNYTLEEQLEWMRPGDIITHTFEKVQERMSVIDDVGKVRSFVREATERGVLFDLGHGGAGFWFSEAIPALEQGLWPNSFGTDLHRFSMNAGMKDMANVLSKFLAMGMPLKEVLKRSAWFPALSIKRPDLGHLGIGTVADLTILDIREGVFGFVDAGGNKISGGQKIVVEMTIREGKIVWDLNGLAAKPFKP